MKPSEMDDGGRLNAEHRLGNELPVGNVPVHTLERAELLRRQHLRRCRGKKGEWHVASVTTTNTPRQHGTQERPGRERARLLGVDPTRTPRPASPGLEGLPSAVNCERGTAACTLPTCFKMPSDSFRSRITGIPPSAKSCFAMCAPKNPCPPVIRIVSLAAILLSVGLCENDSETDSKFSYFYRIAMALIFRIPGGTVAATNARFNAHKNTAVGGSYVHIWEECRPLCMRRGRCDRARDKLLLIGVRVFGLRGALSVPLDGSC